MSNDRWTPKQSLFGKNLKSPLLDKPFCPSEECVDKRVDECNDEKRRLFDNNYGSHNWKLYKGITFSLISSVFFSLGAVIVKYLKNIHPGQISLARCVGILCLSLPQIIKRRCNPLAPNKLLLLLILGGIAGTFGNFLRFFAFQRLPMVDAMVIVFSTPITSSILACAFLEEPCNLVQFTAVILTISGLCLIAKLPLLFNTNTQESVNASTHTMMPTRHKPRSTSLDFWPHSCPTYLCPVLTFLREKPMDSITIMSVCLVNDQLWFGDSKDCIHVYSIDTFDQICKIGLELEDSTPTAIRCMCFVSAFSQVAVSSSNGRLWMCSTVDHSLKEIGNNGIPFLCVINVDNCDINCCDYELWCGQSEGNIAVITLSQSQIKSQHIISHYEDDIDSRTPISERFDVFQITANYPYVWTYLYPGCNIWQWDARKRSVLTRLDCSKLAPCSESLMSISIEEHLSPGSCQVTALTVADDRQELYVGTTWGCIIIVEANTMRPITVFRPYEEDVKSIVYFKPLMTERSKSVSTESLDNSFCRNSLIAIIGKGYRSLFSRFIHLDKNKAITQRGLHSILWSTTDWNIT